MGAATVWGLAGHWSVHSEKLPTKIFIVSLSLVLLFSFSAIVNCFLSQHELYFATFPVHSPIPQHI